MNKNFNLDNSNSNHYKTIKKKMETQMYALSRTTASTWGATMEKAQHFRTELHFGTAQRKRP
jgi:hypothetical protein